MAYSAGPPHFPSPGKRKGAGKRRRGNRIRKPRTFRKAKY